MPDAPIARRINGERVVVLGWTRAILLQIAHPLVAAGVHEHSRFRESPWVAVRRLHATIRAMRALTFGPELAAEQALEGIRSIHRRVNGNLRQAVGGFEAGTPYSAEDPALVLWVHVTLLDSLPLAYTHFVGPLSEAERDAFCEESAWTAAALGAHEPDIPRTAAGAQRVIESTLGAGVLAVGPDARDLARAVLQPPLGWLPPIGSSHRLLTGGLLPPALRAALGMPWSPSHETRFERLASGIRRLRAVTPDVIARWPEARRRAPAT